MNKEDIIKLVNECEYELKSEFDKVDKVCEENTFKVSDSSSKIRIPSKDNLLKSLTISNISFSFNENNTNYQLETKETSVTIKATAKDSNATVTGDIGTKNLKYGGNRRSSLCM